MHTTHASQHDPARTPPLRRSAAWMALLVLTSSCGASMPRSAAAAPASYGDSYEAEESIQVASYQTNDTYQYAAAASATPTAPAPAAMPAPAPQRIADGNGDVPAEARAILAKEHRVIEGWLEIEVERVAETAAAIRARVEGSGGRVIEEQVGGGATSRHGHVQVKIPPAEVDGFLAWIAKQGELRGKRIQSTDVSRQLFDQVIALDNLQRTMDRLRALLEREGLNMQEILAIEKEMTRLRGEIERIKGEQRFLQHKVALATLTIQLRQHEDAVELGEDAEAKLYPGPRLSMLYLLDAGGRTRMRLGGGAVVHLYERTNVELDVFTDPDDTGTAVLATTGADLYSDFLGRGRRRFLNPYLGIRLGFGYLERSTFAFGAGAGVELYKNKYLMLDLNVRAIGLAGKGGVDTAVVAGTGVVVAF